MTLAVAVIHPVAEQAARVLRWSCILWPKSFVLSQKQGGPTLQRDIFGAWPTELWDSINETPRSTSEGSDLPEVTLDKLSGSALVHPGRYKEIDGILRITKDQSKAAPAIIGLSSPFDGHHNFARWRIDRDTPMGKELTLALDQIFQARDVDHIGRSIALAMLQRFVHQHIGEKHARYIPTAKRRSHLFNLRQIRRVNRKIATPKSLRYRLQLAD